MNIWCGVGMHLSMWRLFWKISLLSYTYHHTLLTIHKVG